MPEPERVLVLVADDDAAMRQLLAVALRRQGFEVDTCRDGRELLERLQETRRHGATPALVITDVQMPRATGLDALHWLTRWLPGVPVILITAFGDVRTHRRARELGAALVLDKPFDLQDLQARVAEVLEASRGRDLGSSGSR